MSCKTWSYHDILCISFIIPMQNIYDLYKSCEQQLRQSDFTGEKTSRLTTNSEKQGKKILIKRHRETRPGSGFGRQVVNAAPIEIVVVLGVSWVHNAWRAS